MEAEFRTTVRGRGHSRALMVGDESVSDLVVLDRLVWCGGARMWTGGIGGVRTEHRHRRKGHARRLMEETVRYMTQWGQDVSMLFGISDFYEKFGYAPCLADCTIKVATRDAEGMSGSPQASGVRPAEERDHSFIVRLYNEANRGRVGPIVRDDEHFMGFRKGSSYRVAAAAFVIADSDDRPIAYAALDDVATAVRVIEVNALDRRTFPAVLAELSRRAVERRCEHVELHVPFDHPFAGFVKRCGCEVRVHCARTGGGMMRILNQDSLFEKLRPHLEGRLESSRFAAARVALRLATDLGTTELDLGTGGGPRLRAALSLPQQTLMQLVTGYRDAADVLAEDGVEAEGEVEPLLGVLFGGCLPYVWQADRF